MLEPEKGLKEIAQFMDQSAQVISDEVQSATKLGLLAGLVNSDTAEDLSGLSKIMFTPSDAVDLLEHLRDARVAAYNFGYLIGKHHYDLSVSRESAKNN
jgi:hypothetical protein